MDGASLRTRPRFGVRLTAVGAPCCTKAWKQRCIFHTGQGIDRQRLVGIHADSDDAPYHRIVADIDTAPLLQAIDDSASHSRIPRKSLAPFSRAVIRRESTRFISHRLNIRGGVG